MSGRDDPGPPVIDVVDDCKKIYKGVKLASPKSYVLSKLNVGDTLSLTPRKYKERYILLATINNEDVGSIMHQSLSQIIKCIQGGQRYMALITAIDGGDCSLEIRMEDSV